MTIVILDYSAGNVRSVQRAFTAVGVPTEIGRTLDDLLFRDAFVLPGVGNFGHCARRLREAGFESILQNRSRPILGICVGMQLFYEGSDEADEPGLGLIRGRVERLDKPHVGWDEVAGVGYVYFTHHFGKTWLLRKDNLTGVQFHPEKSDGVGLRFLRDWAGSLR